MEFTMSSKEIKYFSNSYFKDVNILMIILGSLMMLMKLVAPADNKHFKKYQKIRSCSAESSLFIDISLNTDYTHFMH